MFFETGAFRNFPIFTGKHLCWSHFLIKLQVLWPATLFKRGFNTGVFLWILRNNYGKLFWQKTSDGICRSSVLNQKQCGMVSTKKGRSGHSTRYLHIRRNHSNTLLLINLQKPKTCPRWTTGFWHYRQVFVYYLMSILMICKLTRRYIYQVACKEFPFAATCPGKNRPEKFPFYRNK